MSGIGIKMGRETGFGAWLVVFSGYRLSGIHFLIVYNCLHLGCAVYTGGHYATEKLLHFVYSGSGAATVLDPAEYSW